jgi:Asp/Glu/hydantoin racemase
LKCIALWRQVGLNPPWLNAQSEKATIALSQGSGQGQAKAGARAIAAGGAPFAALENQLSFFA